MSRWTKTIERPSEQTFEPPAYLTAVVQNEPDMSEAQRQLQHSNKPAVSPLEPQQSFTW